MKVSERHRLLRDELTRRSSEARAAGNTDLADAYNQMALAESETVDYALQSELALYRGSPGKRKATLERAAFLTGLRNKNLELSRQELARLAWEQKGGPEFFENYGQLYRFLGNRNLFDRFRKPSKPPVFSRLNMKIIRCHAGGVATGHAAEDEA